MVRKDTVETSQMSLPSCTRYNLYKCNEDDSCRYILGNSGSKPLLVCGLNPSTATAIKSDPTCAKSEKVCMNNGYDSYIMTNLIPVRATDFNNLPEEIDPSEIQTNFSELINLFLSRESVHAWAAWGASITARRYFVDAAIEIMEASRAYNVKWKHFGHLTKHGHPRHPSRLNYAWTLQDLDVERYLDQLWHLAGLPGKA